MSRIVELSTIDYSEWKYFADKRHRTEPQRFSIAWVVCADGIMLRVAVIGAGVNGVASAIKILEHYQDEQKLNVQVTILSEQFTPNTTGDGSAGLWGPFLLGGTDESKVQ